MPVPPSTFRTWGNDPATYGDPGFPSTGFVGNRESYGPEVYLHGSPGILAKGTAKAGGSGLMALARASITAADRRWVTRNRLAHKRVRPGKAKKASKPRTKMDSRLAALARRAQRAI